MRVNYKILWFEDNATSYKTKKDFVKDIVEDFGFNFVEPRNEVDGANVEQIRFVEYDLIIADMQLAGVTSITLMDSIRKKNVFTEVLFYSSTGEDAVRTELAKHRIDGAYCSGRDNEEFEYKAKEVIRTLIKKTQDLTNIRGLVMAETSELDKLMEDIFGIYFVEKQSPGRDVIFNKILDGLETDHKKKLNNKCKTPVCYHNIKDEKKSLSEKISSPHFESSQKARAINKIIKEENIKYKTDANFYEDYTKDINTMRNNLAHSRSEDLNGVEVLITKKDPANPIVFNEEKFKEIRRDILRYAQILNELKQHISQ